MLTWKKEQHKSLLFWVWIRISRLNLLQTVGRRCPSWCVLPTQNTSLFFLRTNSFAQVLL